MFYRKIYYKALVPKQPLNGCMDGQIDCNCPGFIYMNSANMLTSESWGKCTTTCLCEQHCAWDRCYLVEPEDKCLIGTGSTWIFDYNNNYWVAQLSHGENTSIKHCHICFLHAIYFM